MPENDAPNVLWLFSDQHSGHTMSCAGHPVVETPHMDRLADEGIQFSNAYCPTPICVPSRVGHLTGRFGHNTGIRRNPDRKLQTDEPTFVNALSEAGYRTGFVGKAHFAQQSEPGEPEYDEAMHEFGFDDVDAHHGKVFAAKGSADTSYRRHLKDKGVFEDFEADYLKRRPWEGSGTPHWYTAPSALDPEDYHDAFIGRRTAEWIQDYDREEPFFMWCNWGGPHAPWDAPGEYAELYDPEEVDEPIEDPLDGAPTALKRRQENHSGDMPEGAWRECRAHYYGMINVIDDAIDRILGALEERGMLENTIVVYASDHGEMLFDRGMYAKGLMYEQSAGVPMLVRYPEAYASGATIERPVSTMDLVATFLDAAGADTLDPCHGVSLTDALETGDDDAVARDAAYSEMGTLKMVREGDWKYVYDPNWDRAQLFNLAEDPDELNNRAADPDCAGRVAEMHRQLTDWMIDTEETPDPYA
jgi:choline-sulfatase